jgi:hypothetical protein
VTALGALGLQAEVCDWRGFGRAIQMMGFVGLVPTVLAVLGDQPSQSPLRRSWCGRWTSCHAAASSATVGSLRPPEGSGARPDSTAAINSAKRASASLAPARLSGALTVS